ncbi:MAG TPA: alpha-glucan family phosphorylase [Candidatus Eisenbacteria bacterium]|nr:alpha-glucan family phosphorylase [Candidatus Eisenbacteria bacterium]
MIRTPHVAYFCMEFGLDVSFPIYSGGLGVLAGDFIKSAHDLRLPVVAVGLRWERGYCVQRIGEGGQPYDEFPIYEPEGLRDTGVQVRVLVRGEEVPCTVWVTTRFGNAPLYLIEPQRAEHRWITRRLYEAGTDVRIAQELLLGVGGLRALNWLGIPVAAYHFNEGHAVFAGLESIAERMEAGMPFPEAWADTRERIVFTTHTPVKAGNEEHSLKDLRRMGACLQLSGAEMRAIGGDPFNMTVAGLRLARAANAVSKLHAETARAMWKHVEDAAPIHAVTNGVHAPTWQSPAIRAADGEANALWAAHDQHKRELLAEIERRGGGRIDPAHLVLGFARRAAGYKRPDLILRDETRLQALLAQGVHVVLSGKAHPDDKVGKTLVARMVAAGVRHPGQVIYLENYDMALGRLLTRGCDVWLNNPIRPLEASGTSGMKAAMNGLLNCSILDGWWPEGCIHGVNGWAIGDAGSGDDAQDLDALHRTLQDQVLPAWRDRARWVTMMNASIAMGVGKFSSDRMLRDYFATLYPAGMLEANAGAAAAS